MRGPVGGRIYHILHLLTSSAVDKEVGPTDIAVGKVEAVGRGVAEGKLVGGQVVAQNKRVPHRLDELGRDSSSPKNVH